MHEVSLFGEDEFHELFLVALVNRLSADRGVPVHVTTYSARGGITRMHHELGEFLRDLERSAGALPDAILAATDANCQGYVERRGVLEGVADRHPRFQYLMVYAIPDPHVERWMMADPGAFAKVLGKGCDFPARKCERGLYKDLLARAIRDAGVRAPLGGREFADDVVGAMDLPRACANDPSLGRAVRDLATLCNRWAAQDAGL